MKKVVILLGLGLALAACGDDSSSTHDATPGQDTGVNPDGSPDGGNPNANFTTFVIDQIKNHTNSTDSPVPYAMFSTLDDPDATSTTNPYASLFM